MKKKLRKLAEDIFNLSYVPIWGLEDKELRIQQYEQILKEVYDDAQQSMLIISGDPIFRGVKLGQMTDRQWQEMQEYFTGGKQKPQFDAERKTKRGPWKHLVCICDDWIEGMEQIISLQEFGYLHDVYYTGKPFIFCPWCGELLLVEGSMRHKCAMLGKAILAFREAVVNSLRAMEREHDE